MRHDVGHQQCSDILVDKHQRRQQAKLRHSAYQELLVRHDLRRHPIAVKRQQMMQADAAHEPRGDQHSQVVGKDHRADRSQR